MKTVTLNGLAAVDPGAASGTPWFAKGQQIVIDPGAPNQQIVRVTAVAVTAKTVTLTLASPLAHLFLGGDTVSVLPAV